jgi:hypothetical protein
MLNRILGYLKCIDNSGREYKHLASRLLYADGAEEAEIAGPVIMGHFNRYYFTFQWTLLVSSPHDGSLRWSVPGHSILDFRVCESKLNTLYAGNLSRLDEAAVTERVQVMCGESICVTSSVLDTAVRGWMKAERVAAVAVVLRNVRRTMEQIDGHVVNGTVAAVCEPQAYLRKIKAFVEAGKVRARPVGAPVGHWERTVRFKRAVDYLGTHFITAVLPEFNDEPDAYGDSIVAAAIVARDTAIATPDNLDLFDRVLGSTSRRAVFDEGVALCPPERCGKYWYAEKDASTLNFLPRGSMLYAELQRRYHNTHKHSSVLSAGHMQLQNVEIEWLTLIVAYGLDLGVFSLDGYANIGNARDRPSQSELDMARQSLFPVPGYLIGNSEDGRRRLDRPLVFLAGPLEMPGAAAGHRHQIATSKWRFLVTTHAPPQAFVRMVCTFVKYRVYDLAFHGSRRYQTLW